MYQVNEEAHIQLIIYGIVDHMVSDNNVTKIERELVTQSGTKRKQHNTAGWEMSFNWKYRLTELVALKYLMQPYPL